MDSLSSVFAALSDPTRRAILDQLRAGPASFTELAAPHDISRPAVVKHLRALEGAGLVRREGRKTRPLYQLNGEKLAEPSRWIDRYAQFWDGALDRLEAYAQEITDQKGGKA
jgi:DNA-binding transcriptional ArsR family regulator